MKSNMDDELSLNKIDDYNNNESKEKRRTVWLVIVFCLLVGAVFSYLKYNSQVDDYVGNEQAPGIDISKK